MAFPARPAPPAKTTQRSERGPPEEHLLPNGRARQPKKDEQGHAGSIPARGAPRIGFLTRPARPGPGPQKQPNAAR